jgi:hypothetical protein
MPDLGTLTGGGNFSRAKGINASGQMFGLSSEKPNLVCGREFVVSTVDVLDIFPARRRLPLVRGLTPCTGFARCAARRYLAKYRLEHPRQSDYLLWMLGGPSSLAAAFVHR